MPELAAEKKELRLRKESPILSKAVVVIPSAAATGGEFEKEVTELPHSFPLQGPKDAEFP